MKKYIRKVLLYLFKKVGMTIPVDIYIENNGEWKFLQNKIYNLTVPRKDDKIPIYVNEENSLYLVKDAFVDTNQVKIHVEKI